MQIVTDSGTDTGLSAEQAAALGVHIIPLVVTLEGKSYREGLDIEVGDFYHLLAATDSLPITSQPSAGDFAAIYRRLAETDPDILSIHISSGLSGTCNSALAATEMVPEANVTLVDTKTLSAASGWQVLAAAQAVKAGWPRDRILTLLQKISDVSDSVYTLNELKYLIHGGRISHMKGLIASVLNIKPIIGVEKVRGTYAQRGQARAFKGAIEKIVTLIQKQYPAGSELRVQVLHSFNPEGGEMLRDSLEQAFACTWLPMGTISLVLGAHTGPSMVGVAYAPLSDWVDVP
jgi:DegV family protein with EDD domain